MRVDRRQLGVEHGLVEALLAAEVVVEQAPGDPGLLGDAVDRDVVEAPLGHHLASEVEQFDEALQQFTAVIDRHPRSRKVPDALLKIGYCYAKLGDLDAVEITVHKPQAELGVPFDDVTVTIRAVPLTVLEALLRSLAHVSYHVGQIVYAGKMIRGASWTCLSIPPGGSAQYNQNPTLERPEATK